jgi:hypothetical protein
METPIQKQDLAQTDDNKQTLRWVALGLWSVCSPIHRSIWSGLSFWYSCEPAFKILLHLGTWIYASYTCWLLSISAQLWWNIFATSPLILYIYTYIHTHDIPFFWISVYLWWRWSFFYPYESYSAGATTTPSLLRVANITLFIHHVLANKPSLALNVTGKVTDSDTVLVSCFMYSQSQY